MFDAEKIDVKMLAYLGDSVYETLVREYILTEHKALTAADANRVALDFVTARRQSEVTEKLKAVLTEEEADIFRRGKNAKTPSVPKSASLYEYRLATGLETLFGYNYLCGRGDRNRELFNIAFDIKRQYVSKL